MLMSEEALYSDDQDFAGQAAGSVASTNYIDHGVAADLGPGTPAPITIQVTEVFDNLTSLQIDLEVDDNTSFSSATTVMSATVLLADLAAGKLIPPFYVPHGMSERYSRLNYTVTGTAPTTGMITAGFSMGNQSNGR